MSTKCPVCDTLLEKETLNGGDVFPFECLRCGRYRLSGTAERHLSGLKLKYKDSEAKLSHAIRRAQEGNNSILLNSALVEAILDKPLPSPSEQADLLIRWLAENVPGPGQKVTIRPLTHGSIIGSSSTAGFNMVVDHLLAIQLLDGQRFADVAGTGQASVTLSFEGWEYSERLAKGGAVYRKAFMAMRFGDEQLTWMLNNVFKPSVKRAGFALHKLDDEPKAGLIDDRLRVEIQSSDFVIADLTHDNLGAYWEAGYAEGLGKPVIYTCEKDRFDKMTTHFDTNHHLTIRWDVNSPEIAGNDLVATIRATLPHLATLVDLS